MRLKKTKQTERTTYTYCYNEKNEKGEYVTRRQTLRPGENGVTEMDIRMLHSLDDSEVYYNIKNMRPALTKDQKAEMDAWTEKFREDFLNKYGYEPTKDDIRNAVDEHFPKNWNMSLGQYESDEDGSDTTDRHMEFADPNAVITEDDSLPPDVRRMREIVATCSEKQQEAYSLVCINGMTENEAAFAAGCSQPAIHQRLEAVKEKIRKNF